MALDDKVFQRGLEVALALSVKELPTLTNQVKKPEERSKSILCVFICKRVYLQTCLTVCDHL